MMTLFFLIVLIGGFATLNFIARNHARAMLVFTAGGERTKKPEALSFFQKARVLLLGVNVPRPRGQATPADVGLQFQSITIPGRNGIQLGAWYCPAPGKATFLQQDKKVTEPTPYPSQEGIKQLLFQKEAGLDSPSLTPSVPPLPNYSDQNNFPSLEGLGVGSPSKANFSPTSFDLPVSNAADNPNFPSLEGSGVGSPPQSTSSPAPLVLLFHGYAADKSSLIEEAAAFHELGCATLLVDFRGSGDSSEAYTSVGFHEAEDVAAAISYAREHLPGSRLLLFGQSMGAVAILRAIDQGSVKPDAIIIEAVFDTMLNTVRNRFQAMGIPAFPSAQLLVFWGGRQFGFDGFKHNPIVYARGVTCPTLVLHGTDDPRARIEEGRRVYAALPASKRFAALPAIGHESYIFRHRQQWMDTVREFLKSHQQAISVPKAGRTFLLVGRELARRRSFFPSDGLRQAKALHNKFLLDAFIVPQYGADLSSRRARPWSAPFLSFSQMTASPATSDHGLPAVPEMEIPAGNLDVRSAIGTCLPYNNIFPSAQPMPAQGDYVVLLHGMGRTARSMRKMETQLAQAGFQVVNLAYPSTREPIETLATNYLHQALTNQCPRPDRKIHFVTHSLGGIVTAYYLQNHPLPNQGRVVMLCPPGQGSELADRWRNLFLYKCLTGPAGQQLGTNAASVPNNLEPVNFELGVIAGDRSLNPLTSRLVPGADDGKVSVARTPLAGMKDFLVVPKNHTFIMQDGAVISQVLYFINNGIFQRGPTNNVGSEATQTTPPR
jgi:alpha-beta hydrolase superfamily lysophospholipase